MLFLLIVVSRSLLLSSASCHSRLASEAFQSRITLQVDVRVGFAVKQLSKLLELCHALHKRLVAVFLFLGRRELGCREVAAIALKLGIWVV